MDALSSVNTLTVKQKPADKPVSLFRIYSAGKAVAALVLPNFRAAMGMLPTDDEIRAAVKQCSPSVAVNDQTVVKWADDAAVAGRPSVTKES